MGSDLVIKDINGHTFSPEDELVFDANIYMRLFGPYCFTKSGSYEYSDALRQIKKNKARILINTIIISEFINAFSQEMWRKSFKGTQYSKFKEYRNSSDFKEVADEIGYWIVEFLDMVSCCEPEFDDRIAQEYMDKYLAGTLDFNDIVISDFCKSNDGILVTHDFDFSNCEGITVLTAYRDLIKSRT
ncbi:MAG: PIN domain-containing protein [Methanothrix sp.]